MGPKDPKDPLFQTTSRQYIILIPLRCKQRAWYAPSQAMYGPSPTLAGPRQDRHGLAFEKNRYFQPELGPFKLERGSQSHDCDGLSHSLMTAMGSLIPHMGPLRPAHAQGRFRSFSSIFSQLLFFLNSGHLKKK